jgi:hypothetical protein
MRRPLPLVLTRRNGKDGIRAGKAEGVLALAAYAMVFGT